MHKPDPELPDDDVPALGDEFFDQARLGHEVLPADMLVAVRSKGGRPKIENPKVAVSIRLDQSVVEHFKASGSGWQSKINALLVDDIKTGRA